MDCKIGFIGAGNMAGAIIDGITGSGMLAPAQVAVYDIRESQREHYAARGFKVSASAAALVDGCDYVVLSVKPQNFADVLAEIKGHPRPETVFVTIAAGISAEFIKEALGCDAKVVRVMPNTPLLAGAGIPVEDFGDGFVLVREVAPILADTDIAGIVSECADKLLRGGGKLLPRQLEDFYHTVACRAAIKAHDRTPAPSLAELIEMLRQDGDADHCPHGRPVSVRMRRHEIEKKFGRLG